MKPKDEKCHQANIKAAIWFYETGCDGITTISILSMGKRVDSMFVMKNLSGMDGLEARPAPSEVIHQTREVHKIDLGLGTHNKRQFFIYLIMFNVYAQPYGYDQIFHPNA